MIGTHRLLSPETRFARLGLVILDEEQRFGVEHKEYLKRLRTEVDVLAMSATPIPRTLEMGVAGIREMSTILTPPEERHPVLTLVGPYDEKQIAAAIRRELLRDGQAFFVHNRVAIDRQGRRPGRRAGARGQGRGGARPDERARRWNGSWAQFLDREHDVLVSTTIVESGLDIPNANTLIVDRADAYGLAQLHQLRGRVGRGTERGYAYFLFPPERHADRDRARAAGHHRPAHRDGRGHVRGAEGPGDPRRRATCWAGSSPGTSPGSASTCTCG